MALLTGLTSEGSEVPVQVNPDGKLVAVGLTGPAGGVGPQGVAGPAGPKGDDKWTGDVDIAYVGGNVGIGTSTPPQALSVQDSTDRATNSTASIIGGTFNSADQGGSLALSNYDWGGINHAARIRSILASFSPGQEKGGFAVDTNPGTGLTERLRVTYDGNLGIGTALPRSLLHASGVISANNGVDVQSPDGSWWNIGVSDAGQVTAVRA